MNNNPIVLDPKTELNEQTAQDVRLQLRQDAEVQRIYNGVDIKDQLELIELGKNLQWRFLVSQIKFYIRCLYLRSKILGSY